MVLVLVYHCLNVPGTKEQCTTNPDTDEPDCLYELQFQLLIIFVIRIGTLACCRYYVCGFIKYGRAGGSLFTNVALPVLKMKIKSTLTTCKKRNPMDYCRCFAMIHDLLLACYLEDTHPITCRAAQLDKDEQDLMKDTWTPFDDYLELSMVNCDNCMHCTLLPYDDENAVIQYGFVTLFISAFPLAPLLAFISNIIEFHMDSSKLLKYESKPFPRKVAGIGSWYV